ncbi:hypothetical protein SAMN02799630_00575 [Paenibacillus sp. UNCCL117]|uniref:hypothetical protein n=1 Tax=unclassified Paenibacillus TaxID=185978 RepID=UPI00088AE792|nr:MULTISPECIES: hypothetical protein [unclassified Paenibacillus]SDC11761.1 hypothetical protein SAMN04488602_101375 [Paenibacillus sp. cl123]SFW16678.1 hypothetical protein SAMN02799630_00575 [Paenibacillus sp. UNCCL117]
MKIRNFYYLIAGVLAMLFAATHAWNGQSAVLPALNMKTISMETQTIFTYVWHIITAENLVFGIAFIFMSFQSERSRTWLAAWMIAAILIVRLLVILGVTAWLDAASLANTFIDSIAIVIYVALITLGTWKKRQSGRQQLQ